MKIPENINWSGFLNRIVEPSRAEQESCGWIFADIKNDVWNVLEVKNVGLKDRSTQTSFAPDKKEFFKLKQLARKMKLTRIGNVHTHVVIGNFEDELEYQLRPSETDLTYARKYNDVVRAVIVVSFKHCQRKGEIYGIVWFDQYGNILKEQRF